jgi:hypothetical protein
MGLFTKTQPATASGAPRTSQSPDAESILASYGLAKDDLVSAVHDGKYPALSDVLALAQAVDQIGALVVAGYVLHGPDTEEGQAALATAGLLLIASGDLATDLLGNLKSSLEAARV